MVKNSFHNEKINLYTVVVVHLFTENVSYKVNKLYKTTFSVEAILYELSYRYKDKNYKKIEIILKHRHTETNLLIKEERYYYYNVSFTKRTKKINPINGTYIQNNEYDTKNLNKSKIIKI